jgi:S1-C subfamily serine protease
MLCAIVVLLVGLAGTAAAQTTASGQESVGVKEYSAVADAVAPGLVQVEYTLQFDKGEAPRAAGWAERCPNCGRYHTFGAGELVEEERPGEALGALLSPTRVISFDPIIHPRFVRSIAVRFGDQRVEARIAAYAAEQDAVVLDLAEPLRDARPLAFNAEAKPPYLAVTYQRENGAWTISVQPLALNFARTQAGRQFLPVPSNCLIVDKTGVAVGMSFRDELPPDDSWKGSPSKWPMMSEDEMKKRLAHLEKIVNEGVLRVSLRFRSPKAEGRRRAFSSGSREEEQEGQERNVSGLLADDRTIVILTNLNPKITARLEAIQIHPTQGDAVPAKFAYTLADYGALVATLEKPLKGPPVFAKEDIRDLRTRLLLSAEVIVQGEKRVTYFCHGRIASVEIGWRQQLYPAIPGEAMNLFLFDSSGALVAIPVAHREKASEEERWRSTEPILTSVAYLKTVLGDLPKYADASNIPLTEEEENRLAWMGVELQPLGRELARANNVSHLTKDGETGGLVTFVYPDSPAAQAGIVQGDILLRLHVEGMPKPIEVRLEGYEDRFGAFPWDRYDELPEQYYDQMPQPWPSAENALTRKLTDVGFGKKYNAEFFHDGQVILKEFQVVQSPPHYDAAPRCKSAPLGLTVRDLTYEVRRYFQKKPDEAGVIASKIEPGSKASVSGIKPFEIISQVNGQPVKNVKDFERLIRNQEELRLSVERMNKGRLVKIKMTAPAGKSAGEERGKEKPPEGPPPPAPAR